MGFVRIAALAVLALAAGCAATAPDRAAQDARLLEAAGTCQGRFASVLSVDGVDQYGRLQFSCAGACPDQAAFTACVHQELQDRPRVSR